jgi:hypothetical protein
MSVRKTVEPVSDPSAVKQDMLCILFGVSLPFLSSLVLAYC